MWIKKGGAPIVQPRSAGSFCKGDMRPLAPFRSAPYNSGGAPTALAKKLFRTLARVIPQCGMVSQAVAFNMFLAFFAVLVTALSLIKGFFEGEGGQKVAVRISAILSQATGNSYPHTCYAHK